MTTPEFVDPDLARRARVSQAIVGACFLLDGAELVRWTLSDPAPDDLPRHRLLHLVLRIDGDRADLRHWVSTSVLDFPADMLGHFLREWITGTIDHLKRIRLA